MPAPPRDDSVSWRVHLRAAPGTVYELIATAAGRKRFWAESAEEREGVIEFHFSSGMAWRGRVLAQSPPQHYAVEYFRGSRVDFELAADGNGGTDLHLTESGISPEEWVENYAGWVSVLLALKAAVDFGVDVRNHDPARTWEKGYVDN
jgi:Activator of Hsp90 ATPase homolog 1-like protein